MLLPKSSCVCYHVLSLSLQGSVRPKYHFWHFFWPDMKTEMGVVIYMYLKHSPDYIDSKYIWVQVFFLKYHF